MNRRKFIGVVGVASATGLAGCSGEEHGYEQCYGDCESVERVGIESETGWGVDNYTEFIILFDEEFSGNIIVETYSAANEVNGFQEVTVVGEERVSIEFDKFKTNFRYKVFLEEE